MHALTIKALRALVLLVMAMAALLFIAAGTLETGSTTSIADNDAVSIAAATTAVPIILTMVPDQTGAVLELFNRYHPGCCARPNTRSGFG